jgi:hypothetical protein
MSWEERWGEHMVRVHRLNAVLAEVRIEFPALPADVEVRGRLMGPRCPGINTVEVAYSLRLVPDMAPRIFQVIIPEPTCWTPERPYRYEGPVDFYRGGVKVGATWVAISLKG